MSYRYLKLDNTIGEVEKLEHLFDPRINDNFDTAGLGERTWKDVKAFLDVLFCQHNLEQLEFVRTFMFSGSTPNEGEFLWARDAFRDVPEKQRFLLAFITRRGRIHLNGGQIALVKSIQSVYSRNNLQYDYNFKELYPHENPNVSITEWINETYQQYKTKLFDYVLPEAMWTTDYFPGGSTPLIRLMQYHRGLKIFHTSSGNTATPKQALAALERNTKCSLDIRYSIGDRDFICKIIQKVSKEWREPLYRLMNYTADPLSILPWPLKEPKEQDPVLIGVELEVSTDHNIQTIVDAADEPFFICKSDGSITGNKHNRMELVTAPASFKYLKRQYALWFDKLDYNAFDVTTDTNNGLHVHVGREHFEDESHIRNFVWFYNNPANLPFLMHISERTASSLNKWAAPWLFDSESSRSKAFKTGYKVIASAQNKYSIVNFKGGWDHGKTLEVRMFKGIVSYASIVKNLEFVEATFNFTRGLTSYRDLTLKGFLNWLSKQPGNKYTMLRKHIKHIRDINDMLITAEVRDIVFTKTKPEEIAEKLNTSGLAITHEHIAILNKDHKRTFKFNRETRKVEVHYNNRSKLAEFDQSFAKRYLRNKTDKAA